MIKSVLIANRGEIAVRIARTCREMGIRTIGVFSEADRGALHTDVMDEAYCIGPAPAAESYLNIARILEVAKHAEAEAVHPGYGFLAENEAAAQSVTDAGVIWIGPPASAIAAMGSKTGARARMIKAGVPVLPGSDGPLRTAVDGELFAKKVGYPILLKAVSGGGGKGMRIVKSRGEMWNAIEAAQREALGAFGDHAVYAEKYLECPRHIEIQILADGHGSIIHLGERECSLQRRHQKIIEESPSIAVTPELRRKMGETAIAAARACGYVNAGTVEMLLDTGGKFYFLEMNTRLQVEHPVTEQVTRLDIVRLQLLIASGEVLPLTQEQVQTRGHALEVRIYAEDVPIGFLPSTGVLKRLRPAQGPGLREDSGMREGGEITRYYDPLISKLIATGETRELARQRLIRALREYEIAGVRTNIAFCRHILESAVFAGGNFHTRSADGELFESYLAELQCTVEDEPLLAAAIARALLQIQDTSIDSKAQDESKRESRWRSLGHKRTLR